MRKFIEKLRNKTVHTEKLAIVRFLLGLSMLLTLLFNDMSVVANHNYTHLKKYRAHHSEQMHTPTKTADIFMMMSPGKAKVLVIIMLLCVMSGFLPQLTGVLHVWACVSICHYFVILNGGDQICLVLSVLLLPLCLTDPRLNQWKKNDNPPASVNIFANVAYFAIQAQASIIYLDSGISKLFIPEWQEGTAAYYFTSHYRLGAPGWLRGINELFTLTPLVAIVSWSIILLELLLAACLFAGPKVKKVFLVSGLALHLLIIFNFGLITFFFCMASLLLLYLDDENISVKLLHRLFSCRKKTVYIDKPITHSLN